jgi:hypothetical protein
VQERSSLADADRLPEPPEILPALVEPVQEAVSLWRLHWGDEPLSLRRYPTGRYRFDAPAGEYPVTYGNKDRLACFAEVYGDARFIPAAEGERKLSFISALRPLWLIPLDDARFRITHNYSFKGSAEGISGFVSPHFSQWFDDGVMFLEGEEPFTGMMGLYRNGRVSYAVAGRNIQAGEELGPEDFEFVDMDELRRRQGEAPAE